jgi:glyoxylate reductase
MKQVFVSCPLPGDAVDRLRAVCAVTVGAERQGVQGPEFAQGAGAFDGLVTTISDRVDGALLARCPQVRVVANVAVGFDNIDVRACMARGVTVTNTPGVLTEATADLAFGLLIAAARRIAEGDRILRRKAFDGWTPSYALGAAVHGATLGVVGFGRIGQAMARRGRGFGMHLVYADRARAPAEIERALQATHLPIDELFATADFVSLHCPLTPETRGLVGAERLARMKPNAILVNTARGGCVDEAALAAALRDGRIAGAGLDVFEHEPHVHPELLALENVVLTPHVGSADHPTREAMARMAVESVLAVLAGEKPAHPVVV